MTIRVTNRISHLKKILSSRKLIKMNGEDNNSWPELTICIKIPFLEILCNQFPIFSNFHQKKNSFFEKSHDMCLDTLCKLSKIHKNNFIIFFQKISNSS